jgi:hypothetical protein
MNKLFRKYFGITMAALILVSSMGVGLIKHHCKLRGSSVHVALFEPENCHSCHKKNSPKHSADQTAFDRAGCCNDVSILQIIDVSYLHKTTPSESFVVENNISQTPNFDFLSIIASESMAFLQTSSLYSFFYGRRLLAFIQSFLI